MTVPPPPAVPGESRVNALAAVIRRVDPRHDLGAGALADALLPFVGDIVEAARRDALSNAIEVVRALDPDDEGNGYGAGIDTAVEALTELRRGQEVT